MDRVTRVLIYNVRAIESVELDLGRPITVLIGENGSGKSTILECLELLRKAAEPGFMAQFYHTHRGMPALLRKGASSLSLAVHVEDDADLLPPLTYGFSLVHTGTGASVGREQLDSAPHERGYELEASRSRAAALDAQLHVARTQLADQEANLEQERARHRLATFAVSRNKQLRGVEAAAPVRARTSILEPGLRAKVQASRQTVDDLEGMRAAVAGHIERAPRVGTCLLQRTATETAMFDAESGTLASVPAVPSDVLAISILPNVAERDARFDPASAALSRVQRALRAIESHVGFDTRASWVARTYQRPESIRGAATLFPAERLQLLGLNLANAWNELMSQRSAERDQTLAMLRLGLGERLDSVVVRPDMGGGNVYLAVQFNDLPEPVYAGDLSDGQLSWLAFVAMARLNTGRSLLAVDEPELHLHPSLLGRVVSMLANLPGAPPVVISTHSDRVLEMLDDPADAVRVCRLVDGRAEVSRIDAALLPSWLEQFGDLGQIRAAGYLPRVLVQEEVATPSKTGGD